MTHFVCIAITNKRKNNCKFSLINQHFDRAVLGTIIKDPIDVIDVIGDIDNNDDDGVTASRLRKLIVTLTQNVIIWTETDQVWRILEYNSRSRGKT